jgi:UDP-N-acetylmuramoyl-L-alanyl-D-glutamate--2,6-diaminopimelate ligase
VINVDDPYGARLAAHVAEAVTVAIDADAAVRALDVRTHFAGSTFSVREAAGTFAVRLGLPGRFNVANALGAWAATRALGVAPEDVVAGLEGAARVPGRFEPVDEGQPFAVLVDYAHTPDSLDNVLRAARELATGRVLVVFGAGGDRDRGKRPLMGAVAAALADLAIVTSDNPRSEDPEAIVDAVLAGTAAGAAAVEREVDRRAAISRAVELARAGDVVVLAGKGHERGQEFAGGRKEPFDDVEEARRALRMHLRTAGA